MIEHVSKTSYLLNQKGGFAFGGQKCNHISGELS